MEYVEHAPPQDLRRHLQCLWELQDDAPGDGVHAIYPDGHCELLAELGVPLRFHGPDGEVRADQALCFAAQQRGPIRLQAAGPVHCIGIRLAPACSALVAGAALPRLRDHAPDLRTLDPAFAADFHAAAQASAASRSPEPLWQLMRGRCGTFVPDALVERAVARLDERAGDLRIGTLATQLAISLRTLQARFLAAVGMTPKEYARVRRLQALLRTLDDGIAGIAEAAAAHGYTDQAHATHDLAHWTGITPARLVRALRSDRGGDEALRLATAFIRGQHTLELRAEGASPVAAG
ncbi:helix-turn-helix domain-containing protein [Luteimonas soli]|uniref:Helix-turn-helix domain-containing protein n=1 Tax=Luteimonas soli TaxID=1648966 RepID=A0ABV7XHD5_9GAMM